MKSSKLVSIIVPVYNVPEEMLRRCIDSLMNQTLQNIEIILVDDGSSNQSGAICDKYRALDSRILVIHKKNEGLSAARNSGAKIAQGDWITFVDGDDWIEKETCKIAYTEGIRTDVDIVIWGTRKDFGKKSVLYQYDSFFEDGKIYKDGHCDYLQEMVLNYKAHFATAYAKLIRRDFIEKNNLYHNETLRQGAEGVEFCLRLFGSTTSALFLKKYWYHYVYNSESISSFSTELNNEYIIKCFETMNSYIITCSNYAKLKDWLRNRILYVIVTTAISSYFHPKNVNSLRNRRKGFTSFLQIDIIKDALAHKNMNTIGMSRKIILFLIELKQYWILELIGKIRMKQKK